MQQEQQFLLQISFHSFWRSIWFLVMQSKQYVSVTCNSYILMHNRAHNAVYADANTNLSSQQLSEQ